MTPGDKVIVNMRDDRGRRYEVTGFVVALTPKRVRVRFADNTTGLYAPKYVYPYPYPKEVKNQSDVHGKGAT